MTIIQFLLMYGGWAMALILAGWLVLVLSIHASAREDHASTCERLQAALATIRMQEAAVEALLRYESECA